MEKEDLEVIRMVRGNPRRSEMLMDVGIIVPPVSYTHLPTCIWSLSR